MLIVLAFYLCKYSYEKKKFTGLDAVIPECQMEIHLGFCFTYAYISATPKISCLHTQIKPCTQLHHLKKKKRHSCQNTALTRQKMAYLGQEGISPSP